jgi:hypothetical protein
MITALGLIGAAALLAGCAWVVAGSLVEKPAYKVASADGPIEIRDYPALVVAEVVRQGDRWPAANAGFSPLARYIFAREREGDKISMTAPVNQSAIEGDAWTVQFIMPSKYDLDDLPAPANADVTLKEVPAARRVAIRFSGNPTDERLSENEATLRAWMTEQGLASDGPPTFAYYNDPFTPGFLKRTEVIFDLR